MPLEPMSIALLALLGLLGGFMAGLLGIGGGMILVPFTSAILAAQGVGAELALKMAIATSMATIVFTSISSVRAHHRRGAVRWDLVRRLAPGIVAGAALASLGAFALIKGPALGVVFAVFVFFSGTQMLLNKKPAATRQLPGAAGLAGMGGVIGFLSGLVGAGGGFVSVPFMTWCNVPIHQAVATSAALGFPIAGSPSAGCPPGRWAMCGCPRWRPLPRAACSWPRWGRARPMHCRWASSSACLAWCFTRWAHTCCTRRWADGRIGLGRSGRLEASKAGADLIGVKCRSSPVPLGHHAMNSGAK